jgi:hypothetical protein
VSEASLSLLLTNGERVVCHLVEPSTPAGELSALVDLYFAPHPVASGPLRARAGDLEIRLDPALPIGEQVPPDAEIHLPTA